MRWSSGEKCWFWDSLHRVPRGDLIHMTLSATDQRIHVTQTSQVLMLLGLPDVTSQAHSRSCPHPYLCRVRNCLHVSSVERWWLGLKWPSRAYSAVRCVPVSCLIQIHTSFKCIWNPTLISSSVLLFCRLQRTTTVITSVALMLIYFLVTWLLRTDERALGFFILKPPNPILRSWIFSPAPVDVQMGPLISSLWEGLESVCWTEGREKHIFGLRWGLPTLEIQPPLNEPVGFPECSVTWKGRLTHCSPSCTFFLRKHMSSISPKSLVPILLFCIMPDRFSPSFFIPLFF